MSKKIFYQPILTEQEWESGTLSSFEVYKNLENAKRDFPTKMIAAYLEGDIEEPTIVDEEEFPKVFYVDIPQLDSEEWVNVETFDSKEEAIAFARDKFGADENGNVSLISQS
jgi:hypothetical protein